MSLTLASDGCCRASSVRQIHISLLSMLVPQGMGRAPQQGRLISPARGVGTPLSMAFQEPPLTVFPFQR